MWHVWGILETNKKVLFELPKDRDRLKSLGIDGRLGNLETDLKEVGASMWT
jgi:hypothetical protein